MKKLKGSIAKPGNVTFIIIAALSLCVLLPLRVFETTTLIESDTGFFNGFHPVIPIFYVLLAAVVCFLFIGSFLNEPCNRSRDCIKDNKTLGVVSALMAASMVYESISEFIAYAAAKSSSLNENLFYVESASSKTGNGAPALFCAGIFAIVSAAFFAIYSLKCFGIKFKIPGFKLLSVSPVIWAICRIVFRFIKKISFVNVSDLLLELFLLVFYISFYLALSQIVTGVTPEIAAWRLYGCGLPAALLAFLICVPRLFLMIVKPELLVNGYSFNPCDLAAAIFIPTFLFFTSKTEKVNE